MTTALFGISNGGLNLVVNLLVLMLVVVWLALIVYTYADAKRRISDPFLVGCATVGSFIPYMGTVIYAILRPPEFLEDAHERELEIRAAELRVKQLTELTCPNCEHPIEKSYLRCPDCQKRLKDPCPSCGKPVDPRWAVCPFCETALAGGRRERPRGGPPAERRAPARKKAPEGEARKQAPGGAAEAERPRRTSERQQAPASAEKPKRTTKRSPKREPDADPRQA